VIAECGETLKRYLSVKEEREGYRGRQIYDGFPAPPQEQNIKSIQQFTAFEENVIETNKVE